MTEEEEAWKKRYENPVTLVRLADSRIAILDRLFHFRGVSSADLRLLELIEQVLDNPPLDPAEAYRRKKEKWKNEETDDFLKDLGL